MTNPYEAYKRLSTTGWTRIELLLALLNGGIDRIEAAKELQGQGNETELLSTLLRAQRIVTELIGGLDTSFCELPSNLQRLYIFVLHALTASPPEFDSALQVLRTLRQAMEGIRAEANAMERNGEIPPADIRQVVLGTG